MLDILESGMTQFALAPNKMSTHYCVQVKHWVRPVQRGWGHLATDDYGIYRLFLAQDKSKSRKKKKGSGGMDI